MMKAAERLSTKYAVGVTNRQFLNILRRDDATDYTDTLANRIDKVPGVSTTDYDGFFGAYVFYTVEYADDSPETHAEVRKLIKHAAR